MLSKLLMGKSRPKRYTLDELESLVKSIQVGLTAHVDPEHEIRLRGVAFDATSLGTALQSFADTHRATVEAEAKAAKLATERRALKKQTQERIENFTTWATGAFGDRAYAMFGLTRPRKHVVSAAALAVGVAKRQLAYQKKRELKAALAPPKEKFVAFDASGKPIGDPPPKKK